MRIAVQSTNLQAARKREQPQVSPDLRNTPRESGSVVNPLNNLGHWTVKIDL